MVTTPPQPHAKPSPPPAPRWIFPGAAALVICATALLTWAASRRPFWMDEANGFAGLFSASVLSEITHGQPGQCSPSPLFYIFFRNWFSLLPGEHASLTWMRLPSALTAAVFLGAIVVGWRKYPLPAFLTAFCLLKDEFFVNHGTEARPYIFWLLLTFLSWFPVRRFVEREETKQDYVMLGLLPFLAAADSTGSLFFIVGIGLFALCQRRDVLLRMGIALLPAALLGVYYAALSTCIGWAGDGIFSFAQILKTHDFTLVKQITKLVISPKSIIDLPVNAGLLFFFYRLIRGGGAYSPARRRVLAMALIFGPATLLTAVALYVKNYYFVPRMFIFLLGLRATLLAEMFCFLWPELSDRVRGPWRSAGQALAVLYCALCLWAAFGTYPLNQLL